MAIGLITVTKLSTFFLALCGFTKESLPYLSYLAGLSMMPNRAADDYMRYQNGELQWYEMKSDLDAVVYRTEKCSLRMESETTNSCTYIGCFIQAKKLQGKYYALISAKFLTYWLSKSMKLVNDSGVLLIFVEIILAIFIVMFTVQKLPRGRYQVIDSAQDYVEHLTFALRFDKIYVTIDQILNPSAASRVNLFEDDEKAIENKLMEDIEVSTAAAINPQTIGTLGQLHAQVPRQRVSSANVSHPISPVNSRESPVSAARQLAMSPLHNSSRAASPVESLTLGDDIDAKNRKRVGFQDEMGLTKSLKPPAEADPGFFATSGRSTSPCSTEVLTQQINTSRSPSKIGNLPKPVRS